MNCILLFRILLFNQYISKTFIVTAAKIMYVPSVKEICKSKNKFISPEL